MQLNVRMSTLTRPTGLTGQSGLTGQGAVNPIAGLSDEEFQVPFNASNERELMKSLESRYQ